MIYTYTAKISENPTVCNLEIFKKPIKDSEKDETLPFVIADVEQLLWSMKVNGEVKFKDVFEDGLYKENMYVISNPFGLLGSGVFGDTDFLKKVHGQLGDFYILPSSIHEVIVVSTSVGSLTDLQAMVKEINETEVKPEDRLSDDVYKFDGTAVSIP